MLPSLLDAWDAGHVESPARWARTLLGATLGAERASALCRHSVGCRDAAVLAWRNQTFGNRMASVDRCPRCDERVEAEFDGAQLLLAPPDHADAVDPVDDSAVFEIDADGIVVRFRLPTGEDMQALEGCADAQDAEAWLIDRCILGAMSVEGPVALSMLPPPVMEAVSERMSELDPQSDVRFEFSCPRCAHRWPVLFDVVRYVWEELDVLARQVIVDVHRLASAHGWSQDEILALSGPRRRAYLALL